MGPALHIGSCGHLIFKAGNVGSVHLACIQLQLCSKTCLSDTEVLTSQYNSVTFHHVILHK